MRAREYLSSVRTWAARFVTRLQLRLDRHAEKEKARWGAHMEYKRRYTNPDDAKKQRTPPDRGRE